MRVVRQPTLEDFLRLPDTKPYSEYIDGEIVQKVPPDIGHGRLQLRLGRWMEDEALAGGLGAVVPELRCILPGRVYVPDLAFVRADRVPRDAEGMLAGDLIGAPDVVVEILSPGQRVQPVLDKIRAYLEHGCQAGVLVDRFARRVLVLRPGGVVETLTGGQALALPEIAADLSIAIDEIFAMLRD